MRILLLGEYSRLHNSLKEGLQNLGHEVLLVATGDSFKDFPADINISSTIRGNYLGNKWWQLIFKLTKYNRFQKDIYKNLLKLVPQLKDFDIVQLINEDAFAIDPNDEIEFYKKVFINNKKVFLSACGEDSHVNQYYQDGKMPYSVLIPFKNNHQLQNEAVFSYKYLRNDYKKLHNFVVENVKGIIPSDLDYAIPYQNHPKSVQMIPNPINVDKIPYKPISIFDKIEIFYGINRLSFYKKGGDIILKAIEIIAQKYKDKVHITTVENLAYDDYIKKYQASHIFIDQLYSFDQGYNALEAMAAGKCVITGAEKEFEAYYQLEEKVAINGLPDINDLVDKLSYLIENPDEIIKISQNARQFIEKNHHYISIGQKYIETWEKLNI